MLISQLMQSREPSTHRSGLHATLIMTIFITLGLTASVHGADLYVDEFVSNPGQLLVGDFLWTGSADDSASEVDLYDGANRAFLNYGALSYDTLVFTDLGDGVDFSMLAAWADPGQEFGPSASFRASGKLLDGLFKYSMGESCSNDGSGDVWCTTGLSGSFASAASPVPLPAAAWLFISALGGLFGVKRLGR